MWDDDSNACAFPGISMATPPVLIHVAPVTPTLAAGVRAVEVKREQVAYVGNMAFNLLDAENDPQSTPMAILANGRVIGYYRLDFAPRAVIGRSLGLPHVGVRAFCIDHRHQGHGHGRHAVSAMACDVLRRHPARKLIVLAVHVCNRAAVSTYQRAGFTMSGQFISGGRAGPQYVMWLSLAAIQPQPAQRLTSPQISTQ